MEREQPRINFILSLYFICLENCLNTDSRTLKSFFMAWPQSKFTFYYIDHIFFLSMSTTMDGESERIKILAKQTHRSLRQSPSHSSKRASVPVQLTGHTSFHKHF